MSTPPWEKPRPKTTGKTKLSPASIAWARAAAKKAGRRYPNLVDNMAAARRQLEAEHRAKGPGLLDRPCGPRGLSAASFRYFTKAWHQQACRRLA